MAAERPPELTVTAIKIATVNSEASASESMRLAETSGNGDRAETRAAGAAASHSPSTQAAQTTTPTYTTEITRDPS